jgi:hypothetical protein
MSSTKNGDYLTSKFSNYLYKGNMNGDTSKVLLQKANNFLTKKPIDVAFLFVILLMAYNIPCISVFYINFIYNDIYIKNIFIDIVKNPSTFQTDIFNQIHQIILPMVSGFSIIFLKNSSNKIVKFLIYFSFFLYLISIISQITLPSAIKEALLEKSSKEYKSIEELLNLIRNNMFLYFSILIGIDVSKNK